MFKCDIIVPVFNHLDLTRLCIASLRDNITIPCNIIVIDNGSTDGTAAWLEKQTDYLTIITNPVNRGFAKAVNQGLRASRAPYAILLNNDTQVPQSIATTLIEAMEADPRIGAMGVLSTAKAQGTWEGKFEDTGVRIFANRYSLGQLPFFCAILRRQALDDVGLLDEEFFLYGEDDDLNLRLMQAGWKLAIHTGITVKHEHGATSKAMGSQHYRKAAMNRIMEKWGGSTGAANKHKPKPTHGV